MSDQNNLVGENNSYIGGIGVSRMFAKNLTKLITRDLNNDTNKPTFSLFSKSDIQKYLANPYLYEKELRRAVNYIYGASPHFRRVIQYFTGLSDFSYYVSPYRVDPRTANVKSINRNYRKVLGMLSSMNIKTQFPKILTVCLREDVFYGTAWIGSDNITIQQLPSDYCRISSIEGNVCNVTFDFSYFRAHEELLPYYPPEFTIKYNYFKTHSREAWLELDCPNSFAIKCNSDILAYSMPPFAGILREIYDIEDYKQLKLEKEEIENYALLSMKIPMDNEGNWMIDFTKAEDFWRNLDDVMPEEVGSILTPMDIEKISFERTHTGETNSVADAEESLFTAAGVSSLLFNNAKASANALLLSIRVDQELTYGIVKSIEDAINRLIQDQPYGKNFKMTFLNCSTFNRKELGDAYLKAASYGLPVISMYAASQGLGQSELDAMSFLETEVLGLQDMFKPLISSSQLSSDDLSKEVPTDEGGKPPSEIEDLTESGEQNREDA